MLNCYLISYTSGKILVLYRQKMTRCEYSWIIKNLMEDTYKTGKNSHAKLYCNGIIVALFDSFVWEDGSFYVCLYGYPVRHCGPKEGRN